MPTRHAHVVLLLTALLTMLFAMQIPRLSYSTDYLSLLPEQERTAADTSVSDSAELDRSSGFSSSFFFVVESGNIFNSELLNELSTAMYLLENRAEFGPRISAFRHYGIVPTMSGLQLQPATPKTDTSPWTPQEANIFRERIIRDDVAMGYVAQPNALLVYYQIKPWAANPDTLREYDHILAPLRNHADVYVSGTAPLSVRVREYLQRDLSLLPLLSLLAMLAVYLVAIPFKRVVWLPFILSCLGLVWTLGMMSILRLPMTIVSIITPPIVITLSSSYSIHLLHEYFRTGQSTAAAVRSIRPTILTASLTTIAGFLSLSVSETRAFAEFGVSAAVGVACCAVLSLTFVPAVTALLPRIPTADKRASKHRLTRWLESSALTSLRIWPASIVALGLLVLGFVYTVGRIGIESDFMSYFPPEEPLYQDSRDIARTFGGLDPFRITISAPENTPDYFFTAGTIQQIYDFEQAISEESADIAHILSFTSYISSIYGRISGNPGVPATNIHLRLLAQQLPQLRQGAIGNQLRHLLSEDNSELHLLVRYYDAQHGGFQNPASAERVLAVIEDNLHRLPDEAQVQIGGTGVQSLKLDQIVRRDQRRFTVLALAMVAAAAALYFRSPIFGVLTAIPTIGGLMGNSVFMFLSGIPFNLVTLSFASITIGVGIDDAAHFLIRYRRLKKTRPELSISQLLAECIHQTGRPIIHTSFALAAGLLMLLFAGYPPVRYFGLLLAVSLLITLFATLFFLPACISALHWIHRLLSTSRR